MSKMADAAAARREARRKKILENSHNRLQIISGKSSDECPRESPSSVRTIVPDPEYDVSAATSTSIYNNTSQHNGVLFGHASQLTDLLLSNHTIDESGDGDVVNDLAALLPPTGLGTPVSVPIEVPALSIWEKIMAYKYDIVLLSLFLQILYSFSLTTYDNSYFFLPVIVYIVTKLIWFPTQSSSGIANMLMLLNGISPARIQRILSLSQYFGVIVREIFIYLFTTVCVQSLFNILMDILFT